MLERSTVITRLLAIGMLGVMGLMLAPEPAWGQSALKEKPPGHSHRFPPLPDKIQRLDAYRQRGERAGLLSKFVYWAAESGSEPTGTIIIDMPSSGPVKVMPDGEPTWVSKPGITITPTEGQPRTTLRVVPGTNGRPVDPNIKQVSATNANHLVHELVVPAASDPSLPPLPDQVQPVPPRKPKVPMIRRVPEISTDTVDSAIQQVNNEEKIATKDLPPVRGTKAVAPAPSAVVAATIPPTEPTLKPLVVKEKPKVIADKPKVVAQKPKVVVAKPKVIVEKPKVVVEKPKVVVEKPKVVVEKPKVVVEKPKVVVEEPKVVVEKPDVVTTNSVPRQLPNLSPEKKAAPKASPKKVVKTQPTTPRPSTPVARPAVANASRRHPSSVRNSDIRRTSADSTHSINSTAVPIPAKTSETDDTPEDDKPRSLAGLAESKELPPIPTDAEVMENQRKFEEALRKAAKKPVEATVESAPTELTLPTDPVTDENAAAPVEFANDEPKMPAPLVEETAPTLEVESTVSEPVADTTMPEEVVEATKHVPAAEPVTPAPIVAATKPEPVVSEPAMPMPVAETMVPAPAVEAAPELPIPQELPAPVVMETAPMPTSVPTTVPPTTEQMSEEEALAKLEASIPAAEEPPVVTEPPVVPSQRVTSTEPAPIPSATMPDAARAQVVEEFLDARSELESLAQGAEIPSATAPGLNEAKLELEALVQGRPIPRTTTPANPAVIPNELMQAQEELAALTRQKQMPTAPMQKKADMPLPSELPRTVLPVPKATSSTIPKGLPVPTKPGSLSTHSLKTPLAAASRFLEILQKFKSDGLNDDQRHLAQQATSALSMTGSAVDALLLLSTVSQRNVEVQELDMDSLVGQAMSQLEDLRAGNRARIKLPRSWPRALGYGPWIGEVWLNLLSNALKYGGVPPEIEVGGAPQAGGMARFWVRDNGTTLSDSQRERVFIPFTRLHQDRAAGHGLGLATVQRIVARLDGNVGASARQQGGNEFYFSLPAAGRRSA